MIKLLFHNLKNIQKVQPESIFKVCCQNVVNVSKVKYLNFLLVKNFSLNPLITSQKPNTQPSVGGGRVVECTGLENRRR